MSIAALHAPAHPRLAPMVFAATIFTSAALVFMVEPMVAKMILPLLGGSPAVWNTCMAFFQIALLAGYLYAHLLQRFLPAKVQALAHLCLLVGVALFLPVTVTGSFGAAPVGAPVGWLLGVLLVSIGVPFAALSATAPLLQAWYGRALSGQPGAQNPYILYAASNLGSVLALIAYPAAIEPLLALTSQTFAWDGVYVVFCLLMVAVGFYVCRDDPKETAPQPVSHAAGHQEIKWSARIAWILLAAGPSSLMLGVTTYISNDVASVPLFWVIPLALYLLTFVIAFQAQPLFAPDRALAWQGACVAAAAALLCLYSNNLLLHLAAYLGAFFFTALVCHQRLAASRPHPAQLTEFYLFISLGGVLGGTFNALLAPVLFNSVMEFPLVLVLCCLARPVARAALDRRTMTFAGAGLAAAVVLACLPLNPTSALVPLVLALTGALAAWLVSGRALMFTLVIGALCGQAIAVPPDKRTNLMSVRSFFGVSRVTLGSEPQLGGMLHILLHGTTIHGAQGQAADFRCRPTVYYAPPDPLGQGFIAIMNAKPHANIGVVGLGSGALAAYTRSGSHLRFFEIDPEVERIARDPRYFTYLSECAKGKVDVVVGDARLTMAREAAHSYDLIQIDAFSADNIPAHLLTVQAMAIYFAALKPDGILMLHLTNRNLKLEPPAAATAKAIGATALMQDFVPAPGTAPLAAAPSKVMLIAKSPEALAVFAHDPRWRPARDNGVRAWSDDYTNILGALID
jgi:predicted O-methyltransferase YrrM